MPRRASGLRYSGSKTTVPRSPSTSPACRGMPNLVGNSLLMRATGLICSWSFMSVPPGFFGLLSVYHRMAPKTRGPVLPRIF